ncbi:MAG TPA: HepT-like ribonuclease domain-containing protein [Candidatus Thermoplasmatota archaeon]|nr:HepT-like ribonuclease domain-containing protein [Candidatus Thermoplasmatota archaeon]
MRPDERRLLDILACAAELQTYLTGKDEDDFVDDRLLQRAVERLLTIVGEAAKHVSQETRGAIPQPWREIIRFRDRGIHGYDSLTPHSLFKIATESLPALRSAIEAFLAKKRP